MPEIKPAEKTTLTRSEIEWLAAWLTAFDKRNIEQVVLLRKINNSLIFFVILAVIAILVSIFLR